MSSKKPVRSLLIFFVSQEVDRKVMVTMATQTGGSFLMSAARISNEF